MSKDSEFDLDIIDSKALNQEIKQNYYLIWLMLIGFEIFLIIMILFTFYFGYLVYLL